MTERLLFGIGTFTLKQWEMGKLVTELGKHCFRQLFRRPWRTREILTATVQIGIGSLPIITIATAFAGLVVTHEIAKHMHHALHTVSMVPGFTGQFILRELGVVIPALLVVSKVGASITAEIGTMKITEQIDALKLLKIHPISYLVFPRWLACMISLMCLTIISVFITVGCAMFKAILDYHFNFLEYMNNFRHFVTMNDLLCATVKALSFGCIIPLIACAYGIRCQKGAQGVGTATTNAVVTATIAVIVIDFTLTYLFTI